MNQPTVSECGVMVDTVSYTSKPKFSLGMHFSFQLCLLRSQPPPQAVVPRNSGVLHQQTAKSRHRTKPE